MDLRSDIACLREAAESRSLSPPARDAAERVLKFLDKVLVRRESHFELPRGYFLEVLPTGSEGVCVPWACESDDPGDQLAYFAADVATGWLEELCAAIDPGRARVIRDACGLRR